MILLALLLAGQDFDTKTLARIDHEFVCPEYLPDDYARQRANENFIEQLRRADPHLTIKGLVDFRVAMLRKHRCISTLNNIQAQ